MDISNETRKDIATLIDGNTDHIIGREVVNGKLVSTIHLFGGPRNGKFQFESLIFPDSEVGIEVAGARFINRDEAATGHAAICAFMKLAPEVDLRVVARAAEQIASHARMIEDGPDENM